MGSTSDTFNLMVLPTSPKVQTSLATQVGSTSARLQANVFDLGGMDSNLTFYLADNQSLNLSTQTNPLLVSETGSSSVLVTGLSPSTTYYFQAKLQNTAGLSNGDAISVNPSHFWELNDRICCC